MQTWLKAGIGVAGAVAAWKTAVEPWWRTWGTCEAAVSRSYRGDELVGEPTAIETRNLIIDATPDRIWPWLLQLGYGRAGWYSYDVVDMRGTSADRIHAEWQQLTCGDIVPTHPGGGFQVRVLEPDRALVLYSDTDLVRQQADAARTIETSPANLRATSSFLSASQPSDFAASWAFILEPLDDGRTRLIERFRVRFGASDKPWTRATLPVVGFGVFLMVRKQLLGIRDRVEGSLSEPPADTTVGTPITRPLDTTPIETPLVGSLN
jgi:hypothetical protein